MISGRMTPTQRNIVKNRCEVNVEEYKNVLNWLISNHPSYIGMIRPQDSPQPTIIGGFHETQNNCDEEEEPDIENNIELTTFRFASRNQPTNNTGPFSNEEDFIFSKLLNKNIDFTLLFKYGSRVPSHLMKIQDLFPIQFPFGRGGLDEKRMNAVSKQECLRHYSELSLSQFMRADFILIICAMYQCLESFTNCIITCRSSLDSTLLGNAMSTLTLEDLKAATKCVLGGEQPNSRTIQRLFSSLRISCQSVGQSNEAAKVARKKYFSLWHLFGSPAVFFTVSPCDECSWRVRLYAKANCCHKFPSTQDIMNNEACLADLTFRKKLELHILVHVHMNLKALCK